MSPADLQKALLAVEPAAVLVTPGVLEKIIQQTLKLPGWMWTVPHRRTWICERQFLFRNVEQEDLLVRPDQLLPATVLLLERPTGFEKHALPEVLLSYWRLLFHATVDLELANQVMAGKWSSAAVELRTERLGTTVFAEVRSVLLQEHHLAPNPDTRAVYLEFVAVFLELYYFARPLLESYFPGIRDVEEVKKLVDEDVDGAGLFQRTRLDGAPDPGVSVASTPHEAHEFFYELLKESDEAEQTGNLVRAAIQRSRAARVAPAAQAYDTRKQAVALLEIVLQRLQPALEIPPDEVPEWSKHLPELLDKADQGRRPPEAYLLYDLQKVCLDFEREIYTLDLVEWLLSGFKKPVQRPLSSQRLVRVTRHLRSAAQRLTMARLSEHDRKHFAGLLQVALTRCENRVRDRFQPLVKQALEDVGLAPRQPFERTAFLKLIDELLDRILEYGFLTFSDLRDALSRNRLKLPDLSDPQDFIKGDPLIRLDRRLSTSLDGVYRRGDFYLRFLERFTALNFGTALGRLITRFVTLPFLGAFLLLEGAFLLVEVAEKYVFQHPQGLNRPPVYVFIPLWLLASAFLLGLLHSPALRLYCADLGRTALRRTKAMALHALIWVVRNAVLMDILTSWTFQLFYWYICKPLILCLLLWLLVPETFTTWTWLQVGLTFLAANFLVNSRPGQAAAETASHGLIRFYALLRSGLIPGLIRLVVQAFKHVMHMLEAVLNKVDEWLRFRRGESRAAMVVRTSLGVVWFPISYLTRFYTVVLIEPGINPIKYPISALFAKFIWPFTYLNSELITQLTTKLAPFMGGEFVAQGVVLFTFFWLPDAATFLVWEMKENWSLYLANQSPEMQPAIIGKHGETMRRLLQPGFHSGTIPKLFARLRHAERKAQETGNFTPVRGWRAMLEEVEEAIRLFVKREFLVLLAQEEAWREQLPNIGTIRLATNQVRIELRHPEFPEQPVWLEFEEHGATLLGALRPEGWTQHLPAGQQRSLRQALTILFQLAAARAEDIAPAPEPLNGAHDLRGRALEPGNGDGFRSGEQPA